MPNGRLSEGAAMKASMIATLALACGSASALETTLVMRAPNSPNQVIEVSPNIGTMTLYDVNDSGTRRASSANFLFHLEFYDKYILDERNGVPYTALRTGSLNCKPTCEATLQMLPKDPTDAEKQKNLPSYQARARASEDAYWLKEHEYDGVIRGAFNSKYVMLCAPSKHALLFYELSGEKMELRAWRNYGVDLLIPQALNSLPTPTDIVSILPAEEKAKLEKEFADRDREAEAGAAQVKETPKSDAWVATGGDNVFVVVDTLNNMIMTYQFTGKSLEVKSVRNIKYDLMIPTAYKTQDNEQQVFDRFRKTHAKEIQDLIGADIDMPGIKALVGGSVRGDASKTGLQANILDKQVVLDYTESRKLLVYNLEGANNSLEMTSARDYTLDVAMAVMERSFQEKAEAKNVVATAEKFFKSHKTAMQLLKFALKLDPMLVDSIEKNTRLKNELSKEADWGPMIDDAHKAKEAALERMKAVKEAAAAARGKPKN
jgi:hypothetical protein